MAASRYFAPSRPPPIAAIPRNVDTYIEFPNASNTPEDSRTVEKNVSITSYLEPAVKKAIIDFSYTDSLSVERAFYCTDPYDRILCDVDYHFYAYRDGAILDEITLNSTPHDILSSDESHNYMIRQVISYSCPSCPEWCTGGCTSPDWENPVGQLEGFASFSAGSYIGEDLVIHDVAPGNVYAIVLLADLGLYEIYINDELATIYSWQTAGGDVVALLPRGFRIRAGDELKIYVIPNPPSVPDVRPYSDFRIRKLDWLVV